MKKDIHSIRNCGENDQSSHMKKLALDLEVEDHHPEHEKTDMGSVDVHKLFLDRLSVHLLKDARDRHGGGISIPNFIPPRFVAICDCRIL